MRKLFLLFAISIFTVTLSHAETELWRIEADIWVKIPNTGIITKTHTESRTDVSYSGTLECGGLGTSATAQFSKNGNVFATYSSTQYFGWNGTFFVSAPADLIRLTVSCGLFGMPTSPSSHAYGYIRCATIF